ncbi:MAG: Rieske 2Fe-2S domain-containing protein [Bacteroidia bacterium]|nr:Rieske 2Fe-2S domain-containing protein [Bacteroidia bacterium]
MEWIKVFSSGDEARRRLKENVPQLLIMNATRLCLVLRNNNFYVVQDSCSHNGESLSKGIVNHLGEIICPWHGHQFNLITGRECSERSSDLSTYPVKEDSDGVFIGL